MESEPIKTNIIRIGNSQGIRIPKAVLAMSGIEESVEMVVDDGSMIIRPARKPREGWAESFQAMASNEDDLLLDEETPTDWDKQEWERLSSD